MGKEEKLQIIASTLTPVRPIRSNEFLRGRQAELEKLHRELTYFDAVPFIYGPRGVGKTSLARTAAQLVNSSSSEHIYAACAPKSEFLTICKEIAESLIEHIYKSDSEGLLLKRIEVELSLAPAIRTTFENRDSEIPPFETVNQAFRVIRQLDSLLPNTMKIVVVIDELEELRSEDKGDLAYFIKQLGDQEISLRFVLVGIADNVHELIGAHKSVPRYIKEQPLKTLDPQDLMDIVSFAAERVGVNIDQEILFRIAIIGNGYPHFSASAPSVL